MSMGNCFGSMTSVHDTTRLCIDKLGSIVNVI